MTGDESQTAIELVDPLVGTIFDKRFKIEERIAAGGFGAIYRARHVKSGHPIALKLLHPTLASDLGVLARFRREGATLTSLRNPHTITAYEFGQVDRTLFIVLELLSGESLYERYSTRGPLPWRRVVHIAQQICESLEEAHALGIVHRDLKPTNIHLEQHGDDSDYVKVLDFGIAKILQGSELDASDITNAGQMIGTLDYMSPEQMVGGQVTGQTDIYTLGIVMYEMIAGTRPFPEAETAGAVLAAMLKTTPEPLYLRAPIPRGLDAIVMRCLERETQKRYRTVGELRAALAAVISDESTATTATVELPEALLRRAASDVDDVDDVDVDDDDDATTVTPPPELMPARLDAVRTAPRQRDVQWDDEEHAPTTASARRTDPSRRDDGDQRTPPITSRRDGGDLPTPPITTRRDGGDLPTLPSRRDGGELATSPIAMRRNDARPAPRPRSDRREPDVELPPTPPIAAPDPARPHPAQPRPFASRHVVTPIPQQLVAAPFSSRARAPSAEQLQAADPNDALTVPVAAAYRPPAQTPVAGAHARHSPHVVRPPSGVHAAGSPATPPMAGGDTARRAPTSAFDMASLAAREAAVRRLVWIIVLVVAAGVGFVLATQL